MTRVPYLGPSEVAVNHKDTSGHRFSFVVQNENKIVCQTEATV